MLKSSVRLALLTSVTCTRPPVSRQIRNESTVPNSTSPRSARARRPGIVSSRCLIFVPGEIGIEHEAGLLAEQFLQAVGLELLADRRRDAALPDDGVGDGLAGGPVPEDGRLALVGDADGGDLVRRDAGLGDRLARAVASCDDQIASGSCSTCPGDGKICGNSCCADDDEAPSCRRRSRGSRSCPDRARE